MIDYDILYKINELGGLSMKLMMEQKQTLKMVMTQELRQAIEILQLSTYELFQFIQEQAMENPLIELKPKESESDIHHIKTKQSAYQDEFNPLNNVRENEVNLYDHLLEQVQYMDLPKDQEEVVRFLILNINEVGYLDINEEEIFSHLNIEHELLQHARDVLHDLEPCGIGARNLADCLLIQAKRAYPHDDLLHNVIAHYLQDLADKRWEKIAKQLAVSLHDIQDVFQTIQGFNPRPAMAFDTAKTDYVVPDITVDYDLNNEFTIQLHEHYLPNIYFNNAYVVQMKQSNELSQYIQQQYKQFNWLQTSIEQRRNTILKIMNVLITYQREFLVKGARFLKPLTLKEVAAEIDMHESTVSRAITNKIIQTPLGIFELRQFFSTKLSSTNEKETSQVEAKELIKSVVEQENKYKPLSDQEISEYLKTEYNIALSRRTVAKYREELSILSSSKRKEIKVD